MVIIDGINSVLQSLSFAYVLIYCVDKKHKIDKFKLFFMTLFFTIIGTAFAGTFGSNQEIQVILAHILALGLVVLLYKKNINNALIAYTIMYCIIGIYSVIFINIIFTYVKEILPIQYTIYEEIFIIYVPEYILIFLCLKYIKILEQVYKSIIDRGLLTCLLILSFAMDFIVIFYSLTLGSKSQLIKNVINIMFFIFFIIVLLHFWKIHCKSKQILKINDALEIKNDELRKIKHDY